MSEQSTDPGEDVNTGGGPYIQGSVNTSDGDFVGRDKTTNIFNYLFDRTPEASALLRTRKILLGNVYKFWVEGVLKRSLHNEVLITLGLEERPNAVDNRPWDMVLQTPHQPDRLLPSGTKIIDVFDQQQQSLLILGAPGSGKTTMLLELARDLIAQAQQDVNQPIPVVLNLSSWATQRQPLALWLVNELNSKYYIARKTAQTWVANDALLLLLDGLDEVHQGQRNACVAAINAFHKAHTVALAVCSRVEDYAALEEQLQLQGAVLVHPLSQAQIDEYFVRLGLAYTAVRTTLQKDRILQELAESPLLLSIMTLAYQGKTVETLAQPRSALGHRQQLFDTYITQMFGRRTPVQTYSSQQLLHWLHWLAENMMRHQQTIFLIERLKPDHLQFRTPIWLYKVNTALIYTLIYGLSGGLIGVLNGRSFFGVDGILADGVIFALSFGLILGPIRGIASGLIRSGEKLIQHVQPNQSRWHLIQSIWIDELNMLSVIELAERLTFNGKVNTSSMITWLASGLIYGVIIGLASVLIGNLIYRLNLGLNLGLIYGLSFGLNFGLNFGLIRGLTSAILNREEVTQSIQPNQGLWDSFRNMWIWGPVSGLVGWLVGWLISALIVEPTYGQFSGPIYGLILGLNIGFMRNGGQGCIKHMVLRSVLTLYNYAPLNYARFLDYCADRIFLRKVGGGYIFVHRLLMEHFASLTEEDIKRLAGSK